MPLRDLAVTVIVFGLLPVVLRQPHVGILVWAWLSYMNPHRLSWGFAYSFPFAQTVALTLFAALLITKERLALPKKPIMVVWVILLLWMGVTTLAALYPEEAMQHYIEILKIQALTFVTLMLINSRERIDQLIWIIVLSIGYFSVKGGVFTLMTGGAFRVWGPPGSFIEGNNELALAILMIVPLMEYLRQGSTNPWIKRGLLVAMLLSLVSSVGSQSRGALLAMLSVAGFFWLKSPRKAVWGLAFLVIIPAIVVFMPASWHERMDTIGDYQNDPSAMGRLQSWGYAINVASHRITGGGLDSWQLGAFAVYAPTARKVLVAHSIYFSILGDHGWIGLLLWLSIFISTWRSATWINRKARGIPEMGWAVTLARMMQVGLIAYATGGAFLSLSYFDLPWHYVAIVLVTRMLVEKALEEQRSAGSTVGRKGLFARATQ